MLNYRSKGEIVVVPAPSGGVASGDFVVVGAFFGVAQIAAAAAADCPIVREGVFVLPKATGSAWTNGDPVFWDSGAKNWTKTAAGNAALGVAAADALSADTTGLVSIEAVPEGLSVNPVSGGALAGLKVVTGEIALDGSNPTPVLTGLTAIVGVSLALKKNSAPGVGTSVVTYDTTGGTLNLYGWKVTASGDATLIASTGTETVGYTVFGT